MKLLFLLMASMLLVLQTWSQTNKLEPTGNAGVGTTNPDYKLQVAGDAEIGDQHDPTKYGLLQLLRNADQGDDKFHLSFIRAGNSTSGMGYARNSNVLGIWHRNDNQGNPLLAFTYEQRIGVSTSTPRMTFQIGDRFGFDNGGWKSIAYNMAWDHTLNTNTRMVSGPASCMYFTDQGNISFLNAPSNTAGSVLNDALYSLILYNSGQVGVGTNHTLTSFADPSFRLMVEGGVRSRKVKVDQSSWPDYVFDSSYHLPPLSEVASFIKQHNHLPGVPSAEEVKAEGLDLGDTQAILLKKIEELTLYILQQDKQLNEQKLVIDKEQQERAMMKQQLDKIENRLQQLLAQVSTTL